MIIFVKKSLFGVAFFVFGIVFVLYRSVTIKNKKHNERHSKNSSNQKGN